MANRPSFCPDHTCTPLTSLDMREDVTGTCIGKMAQPIGHSGVLNDKQWCIMSGKLSQLQVNNEDFEFFIYQMAMAAKRDGTPLKFWMVKQELEAQP